MTCTTQVRTGGDEGLGNEARLARLAKATDQKLEAGRTLGCLGPKPLLLGLQCTIKALIEVPLKNNYNLQRHLFGAYSLGAPCLERRLRFRAQLTLRRRSYEPSCNRLMSRCRCALGLNYALIVAAILSEVEIIQQQS